MISTAGYVKLAKLWERSRDSANKYHHEYYENKYSNDDTFLLYDVYIDITGKKSIRQRPEMLRLLKDFKLRRISCIASQTKGYLAADTKEFCFLIEYLNSINADFHIITEDPMYNIDTITNSDKQKDYLLAMARDYISMSPNTYTTWKDEIEKAIDEL